MYQICSFPSTEDWSQEVQMQSDESAIRAMHETFMAAVNAVDLDRVLSLIAADAVFLAPGQAPFGRDGFPAGFEAGHRQFKLHCVSVMEELVVSGDVAHSVCKDSLTLTPRGGGATTALAGYRLTVYRKQNDGSWRLSRDAHTLQPAER
jgi:uncharacterized protein (TIGR02246 family)